jgi:hypothetical protein
MTCPHVRALLRSEIASDAPGGPAMLAKLADVFLAEIVRRYLSSLDALIFSVPSAAASDPSVGAALTLLLTQRQVLTGKPRLTPPWLGSSQREVTTLPRV